jgi:hypothetical protein
MQKAGQLLTCTHACSSASAHHHALPQLHQKQRSV